MIPENTRLYRAIVLLLAILVMMTALLSSCGVDSAGELQQRLEKRISTVLSLHTAEYIYRDVVYFGEQNQFLGFIPSGSREILFSVNVAVRAGINLQSGLDVSVPFPGKVKIILPPARILYADVDEDTIHQYFIHQSGREIKWIEVQDVIASAKEDLIQDAISRGILAKADRQAESIVRALVEGLGYTVEIERGSGSVGEGSGIGNGGENG